MADPAQEPPGSGRARARDAEPFKPTLAPAAGFRSHAVPMAAGPLTLANPPESWESLAAPSVPCPISEPATPGIVEHPSPGDPTWELAGPMSPTEAMAA